MKLQKQPSTVGQTAGLNLNRRVSTKSTTSSWRKNIVKVSVGCLLSVAQTIKAAQLCEMPLASTKHSVAEADDRSPTKLRFLVNLRPVLPGLVYRSGNSGELSPAQSALSIQALDRLCEAGFGEVFYLYSTPLPAESVTCYRQGKPAQLRYQQALATRMSEEPQKKILAAIHSAILAREQRSILLHDWAGLHAAGYISAIALRQFCALGPREARAYWIQTAGSRPISSRKSLLQRIEDFNPDPALKLSCEEMKSVCP